MLRSKKYKVKVDRVTGPHTHCKFVVRAIPCSPGVMKMFKFLTVLIASFVLVSCAPDSDSSGSRSKKAIEPPPIEKPTEPVQPEPPQEPEFPKLADSNHPLGGWWVGTGSIYDSTGWVSKCESIVIGMVVNTSVETPLAEKSEVSIEKFEYSKCAHGEPVKWGRVVIKISPDGSLILNNEEVGVLTKSQFRFKIKASNGMEYSFELNFIGNNAEFVDFRIYPDKDLMIITDGKLKRFTP